MAPIDPLHNETLLLFTSNGTIVLVRASDNPWGLDLNTLVTIVFGIITIAFQAAQVYHRQGRETRTVETTEDDMEHGGERLLSHRQEAQPTPWRSPYSCEELEEYQGPDEAREHYAPPMTNRSRAPRQMFARDGSFYSGEMGYSQPGYTYRRTPYHSEDRGGGPNSGPNTNGSALDRRYAQRR